MSCPEFVWLDLVLGEFSSWYIPLEMLVLSPMEDDLLVSVSIMSSYVRVPVVRLRLFVLLASFAPLMSVLLVVFIVRLLLATISV